MTPGAYVGKFLELPVPIVENERVTKWETVKYGKYLLNIGDGNGNYKLDSNHPDNIAEIDRMGGTIKDYFRKAGTTLTVHVKEAGGSTSHDECDDWLDLWRHTVKAYLGKGSTEEAQVTLQLAARFGLLHGLTLQGYADKYLGLDCNGYVGNYLVHGRNDNVAWDVEPGKGDFLANKTITDIIGAKPPLKALKDLVPATYLLGLVGDRGNVIAQFEGNNIGHIVITDPSVKVDIDYRYDNGKVRKVPTMYGAESAGGVGLSFAFCQFIAEDNGIFTIKRHSTPSMGPLQFRAFRVD